MAGINQYDWPLAKKLPIFVAMLFFFARLVLLLELPMEGVVGYGDFRNYFLIVGLKGWPFINYWVEYPPLFPFLSASLFWLAAGQEHVYVYLLEFILLMADTGSVVLFARLALRLFQVEQASIRSILYLGVLVSLAYGWWYFEPLIVFLMMLGLTLVLERKTTGAGIVVGIGIAAKFFPGLALLAAWKRFSWKQMALFAGLSLVPLLVSYGLLWMASPAYTEASLRSQVSKGSWQTVWALLDGNFRTGNFGALEERYDPTRALVPQGNPPVISPLASLFVFGGLGLLSFRNVRPPQGSTALTDRQSLGLVGFGWALFALWMPGWSPQWVLYLVPLILLVLPLRQAALLGAVLVMLNLLEWPVLLSRGLFWGLWVTILLRALILVVMALSFYHVMTSASIHPDSQKDQKPLSGMV